MKCIHRSHFLGVIIGLLVVPLYGISLREILASAKTAVVSRVHDTVKIVQNTDYKAIRESVRNYGSNTVDTAISCAHALCCPHCLFDPSLQITKLQEAIENNDTKLIDLIIRRRGMSPNEPLRNGLLPLIFAAKKANVEAADALLRLGADVNSQINDPLFGITPHPSSLIAVCASEGLQHDRVDNMVALLLGKGANPTKHAIMLTANEEKELMKIREKCMGDPVKEEFAVRQLPPEWFEPRTADKFAMKHGYFQAAKTVRDAAKNWVKKNGLGNNNGTKTYGF